MLQCTDEINFCFVVTFFLSSEPDDLSLVIKELDGRVTAVWDELALILGIKQWDIDTIKRDCNHECSQCLQRALSQWLCNDQAASWKKLTESVLFLNFDLNFDLCEELVERHCKFTRIRIA